MSRLAGSRKKIVSIVGTRPQFIKAAMLTRTLRKNPDVTHMQIHTGQHYNEEMARIFFDELDYHPDFDLGVGSASQARQTGEALIGIEEVLTKEKPDLVIVYGDTNATLAGALAAAKLNIKLIHVEAGLRSWNRRMPEEINRLATDSVSNFFFCPTPLSVDNLKAEGHKDGVFHTGDILLDTMQYFLPMAREKADPLERLGIGKDPFWLLTMHRPATVDEGKVLQGALQALVIDNGPRIIFPCHPRTARTLKNLTPNELSHITLTPPLSYFEMLQLEEKADLIITDSGGVQREAYFLSRPCVTLREETEWPETLEGGWNRLTGTDPERIRKGVKGFRLPSEPPDLELFGTGNASKRMHDTICALLETAPS